MPWAGHYKNLPATVKDKTTQKDLGSSHNTKREATNDAGFENCTFEFFQEENVLVNGKIGFAGK